MVLSGQSWLRSVRATGRARLWATVVVLVLLPMQAQAWVRNASDHVIWVKPEVSAAPVRVAPGERYDAATQDGIAAPHLAADRIYKTVDRCSAEIDNAAITVRCTGLAPTLGDALGYGGWKDRDWLRVGWQALFEKAGVFDPSQPHPAVVP